MPQISNLLRGEVKPTPDTTVYFSFPGISIWIYRGTIEAVQGKQVTMRDICHSNQGPADLRLIDDQLTGVVGDRFRSSLTTDLKFFTTFHDAEEHAHTRSGR
jgi:hypothetical protein